MSFKRKLITAATSALAAVAFTTFVSAQDATVQPEGAMQKQEMREGRGGKRGGFDGRGMRGKHGGADKMMVRGLGQLNLSDAQKEQIRGIIENSKTATQPQLEEMRALKMKKRDGIISADEQTRAKELRTQLQTQNEQTQTLILNVLTSEQRTQLDQIKAEMKQRKSERRQNRQNQTAAPSTEIN